MSAFDAAAREVDALAQRVTDLETLVRSLLDQRQGPARIAYKPAEVAAMLGKNPATIREWIKDGRLPAEDMGGWYAIPASVVDAMVRGAA